MESGELIPDVRPELRSDGSHGVRAEVGRENARGNQLGSDFVCKMAEQGPRPQTSQGLERRQNAHKNSEFRLNASKSFSPLAPQNSAVNGCSENSYNQRVEYRPEVVSENVHDRSKQCSRPQTSQGSEFRPEAHKNSKTLASKDFNFRPPEVIYNQSSHKGPVQRVRYRPDMVSENERRDMLNERTERRSIDFEIRDMQSGKSGYGNKVKVTKA